VTAALAALEAAIAVKAAAFPALIDDASSPRAGGEAGQAC
jgi:hypothetical protein